MKRMKKTLVYLLVFMIAATISACSPAVPSDKVDTAKQKFAEIGTLYETAREKLENAGAFAQDTITQKYNDWGQIISRFETTITEGLDQLQDTDLDSLISEMDELIESLKTEVDELIASVTDPQNSDAPTSASPTITPTEAS